MAGRSFLHFSDKEVAVGCHYAATDRPKDNFTGAQVDADLLRTIANQAGMGRNSDPSVILPALVGELCRKFLRERDPAEQRKYEAYVCGTMKMFADRRAAIAHSIATSKKKKRATTGQQSSSKYHMNARGQFELPLPRPRGAVDRK